MEEKKINKTIIFTIVSIVLIVVIVLGATYAYFRAAANTNEQEITTANLKLAFDDSTSIVNAKGIKPIVREEMENKAVKKTFTVTNTGDKKMFVHLSLDILELPEDLTRYDFMWSLYEDDKNIGNGSFEYAEQKIELGKYRVFEVDEEKEYTVYIWIEETNLDQNIMMGETFNTVISATGEMYRTSSEEDFDIDENGVITLYKGEGGNVIIPETINGTPVTAIGPLAFSNVIADVETFEVTGFKDMNPVTSVVIPEGVTTIGAGAFIMGNTDGSYIGELEEVILPSTVTDIQFMAFTGNKLTTISIPNSVTTIGQQAFDSNQLTNVVLPNSVVTIGRQAFNNNELMSVILPSSVTEIDEAAFSNNRLENVIIGNSLTVINIGVFSNNQLTNLVIPNSVENIYSEAFANNRLINVVIPNSVTYIGVKSFYNNRLTNVVMPNSVTFIGQYAFANNQLTSIELPSSVTTVERAAFNSTNIETIIVRNSLLPSGFENFWNCTEFIYDVNNPTCNKSANYVLQP